MVLVKVKWNKEVFDKVELDQLQPVSVFKNLLLNLTGVPLERQKIMAKGAWKGILRDDADLNKCSITEGMQVMLMGTADVIKLPSEKVVFIEDMNDDDLAKTDAVFPSGLMNLGNTCYMNSTLQCLRKIPELRTALSAFNKSGNDFTGSLTHSLKETFEALDRSTNAIAPLMFLHSLRMVHPQFAQQSQRTFMQQDAEEFYSCLLSTITNHLKKFPNEVADIEEGEEVTYKDSNGNRDNALVLKVHYDDAADNPYYTIKVNEKEKQTNGYRLMKKGAPFDLAEAESVVDALFGIEIEDKLQCEETDAEPIRNIRDKQYKIVCNIQGGAGSNVQVSHLNEGIRIGMTNQVELESEALGRVASWKKQRAISKLSRYICVQFMRFYWKATPNSQDHTGVKCKIMKPVTFPIILDMYEYCTDQLKKILDVPRAKEDSLSAEGETKAQQQDGSESKKQRVAEDESNDMDFDEKAELEVAMALSKSEEVGVESIAALEGAAGPGLPPNFKGRYELFALVTHKGRDANGGHYVSWIRRSGDDWFLFDDSDVSPCKTEDIMNLKGGGDWHMAYLAFYRYKD